VFEVVYRDHEERHASRNLPDGDVSADVAQRPRRRQRVRNLLFVHVDPAEFCVRLLHPHGAVDGQLDVERSRRCLEGVGSVVDDGPLEQVCVGRNRRVATEVDLPFGREVAQPTVRVLRGDHERRLAGPQFPAIAFIWSLAPGPDASGRTPAGFPAIGSSANASATTLSECPWPGVW